MRLSITSEYRFVATPDGAIWTDGPCHFDHWTRYLARFSHVNVLARVRREEKVDLNWRRADGSRVGFSTLPRYSGPWQYMLRSRSIVRAAAAAVRPSDAVLLNVPSQISACVAQALLPGRPYGIQVLGDPYDVLAPGVISHPLRPLMRWWCSGALKRQAERATAALYVTREALQRRYPCNGEMFGVSDVDLASEAYREPRHQAPHGTVVLVSVGTMTQLYKGFDILLEATALLRERGFDVRLNLVGDGKFRCRLESQAKRLNLEPYVLFRGQVAAGEAVRRELESATLFVLPSRTEGLPRALIEAMALGLPCIATRVGGIPELLSEEHLVSPGDAEKLAEAISVAVSTPGRLREMGSRNYSTALRYRAEDLQRRRMEFFETLEMRTSEWIARGRTVRSTTNIAHERGRMEAPSP